MSVIDTQLTPSKPNSEINNFVINLLEAVNTMENN